MTPSDSTSTVDLPAANVLAVIPAKGTSSRVPGKNLRLLGGVPLFLWTVRAAQAVQRFSLDIVVSTDAGRGGNVIAQLATDAGVSVIRRPDKLCRDPAQVPDVICHALKVYESNHARPDAVCVLLPTSPFRTARDIEIALTLHLYTSSRPNVVAVTDGRWLRDKLHADYRSLITVCEDAYWLPRREERAFSASSLLAPASETLRLLSGAIWVASPDRIKRDGMISPNGALPYCLDADAGLDIDTPIDFMVAEAILAQRTAA